MDESDTHGMSGYSEMDERLGWDGWDKGSDQGGWLGEDETHKMNGISQMDRTDCWRKQTGNRLGRLMYGWVSK